MEQRNMLADQLASISLKDIEQSKIQLLLGLMYFEFYRYFFRDEFRL